MEITTKPLRRCDLVIAKGRIDSLTAKQLAEAFAAITNAGRYRIVLNMKEVEYLSSAGVSALIDTQNTCKFRRGELVLAEATPRTFAVLELAGMTALFKMFDSEIEAVGSF